MTAEKTLATILVLGTAVSYVIVRWCVAGIFKDYLKEGK